jgi:pimeloyl-ACP methyl ester carboxylesterase
VARIIDEALAFPHKLSPEAVQRMIDALVSHAGTTERLRDIAVPTLVLAGGKDLMTPPEMGRADAFWRHVDERS